MHHLACALTAVRTESCKKKQKRVGVVEQGVSGVAEKRVDEDGRDRFLEGKRFGAGARYCRLRMVAMLGRQEKWINGGIEGLDASQFRFRESQNCAEWRLSEVQARGNESDDGNGRKRGYTSTAGR